jgi:glycosyltransferase involved in cell wall biosynthesis
MVFHQFLVSSELGGAGQVALRLASFLTQQDQQSPVWIPGYGPAWEEAKRLGLTIHEYDAAPALTPRKLPSALCNWRIGRAIHKIGCDLIHVHSPYHYGALHWGLRLGGGKRVVHVQLQEEVAGLRWAFAHPPDLIVTCARFLVEHVRAALPESLWDRQWIEVVPNAVDTEKFAPVAKGPAKQRIGAPPDMPLALMLANLAPHKGQETAIRAVAGLRQRGTDVACWLAGLERGGETTYTNRLQTLIRDLGVQDRVRLLGPRQDAAELLQAADVFLLPSTREGLPLSVLEAQACGVPVLAAPTAGIPEVVHDGQTGFLVAAADPAGYADRMQAVLKGTELTESLTEAALLQVRREYSWSAFCRSMWELYQELTTTHGLRRRWWNHPGRRIQHTNPKR